jgi:hypothetical protein
MLTLLCRIRPTVFLLVTNASLTSVTHVYDDCSAVHASIRGKKKAVLRVADIFELRHQSGT